MLRNVSQSKYANSVTVETLRSVLTGAKRSERHEFWPDSIPPAADNVLDTNVPLSPAMLTDVYLLALVVKNQGRSVTLDSKIVCSAVRNAGEAHLLMV